MAGKYPNVVRAISETAWAILPETLDAICEIVAFRAQGGALTQEEIQARVGAGPAQRPASLAGAIGVLPLYGVLFPRASLFTEMSGGTSVEKWTREFQRMVDDDAISSIVLDVHSPGGSMYLIPEAAARVRAARGRKPIVAVANALCASAAYYIAAQADEVVATPSALVGSIGVYMVHADFSQMNKALGVKPTYISAGKFKTEGNPDEPLSDETRAHFQEIVDDAYSQFVNDVAKGRGVRVAEVRNGFGQGRVVPAALSVELGLADRVDTLQGTLARLSKGQVTPTKARASTEPEPRVEDEPPASSEAANDLDDEALAALASIDAWAADSQRDMQALPLQRALRAFDTRTPSEETQ